MNRSKLLLFISVQKRTFSSIYRRFGYRNGAIGRAIKDLAGSGKIEAVQEHCRIGGLRMKFRIVK